MLSNCLKLCFILLVTDGAFASVYQYSTSNPSLSDSKPIGDYPLNKYYPAHQVVCQPLEALDPKVAMILPCHDELYRMSKVELTEAITAIIAHVERGIGGGSRDHLRRIQALNQLPSYWAGIHRRREQEKKDAIEKTLKQRIASSQEVLLLIKKDLNYLKELNHTYPVEATQLKFNDFLKSTLRPWLHETSSQLDFSSELTAGELMNRARSLQKRKFLVTAYAEELTIHSQKLKSLCEGMRSELSLIKNRLDEHRNVLSLALNNKEIVNLERWLSQLEQFNQQIGELGNFADTAHATYQASLEKASGHLEKTVQILSEKYGKKKAQEAIVKAQQLESSAQFLMSVNASVKTIDLPLVFSKFLDLPFYAPIYRSNIQFLSDLKVCEQETLEDWMKTGCQNLIPVKADVRRYLGETLPGILKDNLEIAALMSGDHKIESALKNVQKHLDNENLEKAVLAYDQAIAYGESLGSRD